MAFFGKLGAVSTTAIALVLALPAAAQATDPQTTGTATTTSAPDGQDETPQDIVVTGFRASLNAALD